MADKPGFFNRNLGYLWNIGLSKLIRKTRFRNMKYEDGNEQKLESDMREDLQRYESVMNGFFMTQIEKEMADCSTHKINLLYMYAPKLDGTLVSNEADSDTKQLHNTGQTKSLKTGIGPYTYELADFENEIISKGTITKSDNKFVLEKKRIIWDIDSNGNPIEEEIGFIGTQKIAELTAVVKSAKQKFSNDTGVTNALNDFQEKLNSIVGTQMEHQKKYTSDIKQQLRKCNEIRERILISDVPKNNVFLSHTFKIIKPFRKNLDTGVWETFAQKFPQLKRGNDISPGLDENGMPYEVEDKNSGNCAFLVDKWKNDLLKNNWQKNNLSDQGHSITSEEVRSVPAEWTELMDPLLVASYRFNEWDAIRDDFRDGRYHPYSNTYFDYILSPVVPNSKINMNAIGLKGNIIDRMPIDRSNLPHDEKVIYSKYRKRDIKYYEGKTLTRMEPLDSDKLEFKKLKYNMRQPHHLCPAFDRAALETDNTTRWMHWGRPHYYGSAGSINQFGVHPDPTISTRGYAKFLIDWALKQSSDFEQANEILGKIVTGWDFGIRGFMKKGTRYPLTKPIGPGM